MPDADLVRFSDAQDEIYDQVVELTGSQEDPLDLVHFFRNYQVLGVAQWLSSTPFTI